MTNFNPFPPRPVKTIPFIILLCDHQQNRVGGIC